MAVETHQSPRLAPVEAFMAPLGRAPEMKDVDDTSHEFPHHLARTALKFGDRVLEANKSTTENLRGHQLVLLGRLPDFIDGSQKLDEYDQLRKEGERPSREDILDAKRQVINYNHAIRDLIDSHPYVSSAEITHYITRAAASLRPDDPVEGLKLAHIARVKTGERIIGMKHEMGAAEVFWQIPEVEDVQENPVRQDGESDAAYEERCIEDELHGIDLRVLYKGRWVTIDIKASERRANEKREKQNPHNNKTVMWSHLQPADFTPREFRISQERARELAPVYQAELESVIATSAE